MPNHGVVQKKYVRTMVRLSLRSGMIRCSKIFFCVFLSNWSALINPRFQENKFFWRTAIGNGILGGIHIGERVLISRRSPYPNITGFRLNTVDDAWEWVDDDSKLDDSLYDNRISSEWPTT